MKRVSIFFLFLVCFYISKSQVYILDEDFNSAPVPTFVTLTGGGFSSYATGNNYGRDAKSLQLNTTNQTISYNWAGLIPDLIQFCFIGSAAGSSILVEESTNGIAWSTVGNPLAITTNSTYVAQLLSTTRFIKLTFTKVVGSNVGIDDLKIRQAGNCTTGPAVKWLCINGSCGTSTCEGGNEFVYCTNGNPILNINDLELSITQGDGTKGNTIGGNLSNTTTKWVTNAGMSAAMTTYISNLNTLSGCTGNFIAIPPSGDIPPNANFILFTGTIPDYVYNFSTLCSQAPIYILFANYNCTGKFGNGGCASNCNRGISISNTANGCIASYSYTSGSFGSAGAGVIFNTPTTWSSYNSGCSNFTPLPLKLTSFYAKPNESAVQLNWHVETEENVNYYLIERSTDGLNFSPISTIKSMATVNQNYSLDYTTTDYNPQYGINYYRLTNIDNDWQSHIHKTIMLNYNQHHSSNVWVNQTETDVVISFTPAFKNKQFYLIDMNGKLISNYKNTNDELNYFIIPKYTLPKGLYVIGCSDGSMPPQKTLIN